MTYVFYFQVGNYFWPRISKIYFKGKYFMLRVRDKNNDENTYGFETPSRQVRRIVQCGVCRGLYTGVTLLLRPASTYGSAVWSTTPSSALSRCALRVLVFQLFHPYVQVSPTTAGTTGGVFGLGSKFRWDLDPR